jgi:RNA polymerase sigma-70 factor (ECF subfamily)
MLKSNYAIQTHLMPMVQSPGIQVPAQAATGEEEEIAAAKANPAHFSVLYNRYYEPVFRFVYQRLDSKDLAADICAQVFLNALTHLKTYKYQGLPMVCWLYRIAGNELKQLFRKNARHRTINIESSAIYTMIEDIEESRLEPYYEKMLTLLPDLAEEELQLIEMRYFEKRPFKEIGDILDITENNAKVKVYRILDKMKKKLTSTSGSTKGSFFKF